MHVDEACVTSRLVAPDPGEQIVTREHAARLPRERAQKLELGRGQLHLPITGDGLDAAAVDHESAEAELFGTGALVRHLRAAEQRFDPREQLVVVEGLADVVVRADTEADDTIRWLLLGGDEQDRDVGVASELEAEADAIEARHHHVEGHDVRPYTLERINGLTRIGNNVRRVAFLGQDAREQHRDVAVVLDDHDPRAGVRRRDGGRWPLFDHRDGPVSHLPCHM